MKSFNLHEIQGYIQTIFLVEEDCRLLLLDGCSRCDVDVVKDYIENNLKMPIDSLTLVICTHAHPDHFGGVSYFKEMGIKVAGSPGVNNWYKGIVGGIRHKVDIFLTYLVAFKYNKDYKNIFFPRFVEFDYYLGDLSPIPFFDSWIAIEASGHTDHDISILNLENKIAYVADNFVISKNKLISPYPLTCPEKYKSSLKKYISLNIKEFLLAHRGMKHISKDQITQLIASTPKHPRVHSNTLHTVVFKFLRLLMIKKLR